MSHLNLTDLIILKVIHENDQPTQSELLNLTTKEGLINELIIELDLPPIFNVRTLTANWGLLASINRLRKASLMPDMAPYQLTREGKYFLESLGPNIHAWPISVPCQAATPQLHKATYIPEELR